MMIRLNTDKELVKQIQDKIKQNKGHCCCAVEFTDDNICMCKEFRDKIEKHEPGFCGCGLYEIVVEDK